MTARLASIVLAVLLSLAALLPSTAAATAPALQLAPLQYEDSLGKTVKTGHIDVSNPTDGPVEVQTSVKGFRQKGTTGDLEFYGDSDLSAAITTDLTGFEIGPREAIRVIFSVNPAKLPAGGTYAAIFFATQPAPGSSTSSYISESANLGTLLILRNGVAAAAKGGLIGLNAAFWQISGGLSAGATIANTAPAHGGVAFHPQISARIMPWSQAAATSTGLVLPGATRRFAVNRPGSYFGLLPLTVTDAATHTSRTAWVFAWTGFYHWFVPGMLVLMALGGWWFIHRRTGQPKGQTPVQIEPATEKPAEPVVKVPVEPAKKTHHIKPQG
jgi:hypothetical protein